MSLSIDPSVARDLADLASRRNISVNTLLGEFAAQQKRYWRERNEDQARLKAMRDDGGIAHDEMMNWLEDLVDGKAT